MGPPSRSRGHLRLDERQQVERVVPYFAVLQHPVCDLHSAMRHSLTTDATAALHGGNSASCACMPRSPAAKSCTTA